MSNFITGKDLLTHLDILPFELFDHVKNGLQPLDQFGRPISPPDIAAKLRRMNELESSLKRTSTKEELAAWKERVDQKWKKLPELQRTHLEESKRNATIMNIWGAEAELHKLTKEIGVFKSELQQIEDKYSWVNYELPKDEQSAMRVINSLLQSLFDLLAITELTNTKTQEHENKESVLQAGTITDNAANYFKRSCDFWTIQYEGNERTIKHLQGLQYIAYLIERPQKTISCINLSWAVNPPDNILMSENRAAEEGLNIATTSRLENDGITPTAQKLLMDKYRKLKSELENCESNLERKETEAEITKIMQSLNPKKITDQNNIKAQSNIKKSIDRAIKTIDKLNMKDLAAYLTSHIHPDGNYGYIYTGTLWEVTH